MKIPSILIIDDDEADRYLLRRLLRKTKLTDTIFEVGNGQEALAFFADRAAQERAHPGRFPPVLVFLDINMPLVNGFEFLEKFEILSQTQGYESMIFMMFSSSERDEDRNRALNYDFVKGFITKLPDSPAALREEVSKVFPLEWKLSA